MTLDLSALRAKLNELKGVAAKNDILWKPTEGDNLVRIVPLKDNPENPFIELYFHYLGNKTYLSPLSFGEPDPIAEFAETLRAGGGLSKEEWQETKKFVPQRRTFVPVVDRNKPANGVRFWAFGKTVYSEVLSVMADPEYGDITDPQTGRDIKVVFTPQEKSDTSFAKTAIRVSVKQTPLTKDAEELEKFLNEQPDLMSIHKKMSYDELKNILNVLVGGAPSGDTQRKVTQKTDDDWGEGNSASPSAEKARDSKSRKTANDVEDEFASMFDK